MSKPYDFIVSWDFVRIQKLTPQEYGTATRVVSVKIRLHHDKSLCLENMCIRKMFNIYQALAFYDDLFKYM